MPPAETVEEGVYCEGCHTIEAEWKRPKSEVTPPQSSIEAAWKVNSFGAFEDAVEGAKAKAAGSAGAGGNGAKANGSAEKAADRPKRSDEKAKALAAKGGGERTPFGRGPKGKQGRR